MKKNSLIVPIIVVLVFNAVVITASIMGGINKNRLNHYFEEKETVTFFSAFFLGATGLLGLKISQLQRRRDPRQSNWNFWFVSGIGFLVLCLDEYFMMHEGVDSLIMGLMGVSKLSHQLFDGFVLAAMGLGGLWLCYTFRHQILKYREFVIFVGLGFLGLAGKVAFHCLEDVIGHALGVAIESSFKIVGVSFFFAGYVWVLDQLILDRDAPRS